MLRATGGPLCEGGASWGPSGGLLGVDVHVRGVTQETDALLLLPLLRHLQEEPQEERASDYGGRPVSWFLRLAHILPVNFEPCDLGAGSDTVNPGQYLLQKSPLGRHVGGRGPWGRTDRQTAACFPRRRSALKALFVVVCLRVSPYVSLLHITLYPPANHKVFPQGTRWSPRSATH